MQRHGLRHRPWVSHRGEPRGTHRRETPRQITQPRGRMARRGHGPAGQPTGTATRAPRGKPGSALQGRTLLKACPRHMASRRPSGLGAGRGPRRGSRDHGTQWYYDARWHFAPPPSDKAYGAADEGALEWGRSQLQSRALLTPAALDGGVRAGAAPGGPALHAGEPPALHGAHKYMARRESTTPPRWTAGGTLGTEGNLPIHACVRTRR